MSTYNAFLAAHPDTDRECHTGGGCMSWCVKLANGGSILIGSFADGAYVPERKDRRVGVSCYGPDGEWFDENSYDLTWAQAIAFVHGAKAASGTEQPRPVPFRGIQC